MDHEQSLEKDDQEGDVNEDNTKSMEENLIGENQFRGNVKVSENKQALFRNIGKDKIDGTDGVPANDGLDNNKTPGATNISTHKIESLLDISLTDLNDEIITENDGNDQQEEEQGGKKNLPLYRNPEESSTGMGGDRSFLEQEMAKNIALEEEAKQMLTDSSSFLLKNNGI